MIHILIEIQYIFFTTFAKDLRRKIVPIGSVRLFIFSFEESIPW
jgi:hypothetical protein